MRIYYLIIFLLFSNTSIASAKFEKQYTNLIEELRCMVCQNQNLAESEAPLAVDMKEKIREMLEAGKTEKEIKDLATAIGVNPGENDLSKLRYGKICILADADSDGLHIATLLCALFLRHYKSLIQDGRVHVAMPPLFRIDCAKEKFYAVDEKEKEQIVKDLQNKPGKPKVDIQRLSLIHI